MRQILMSSAALLFAAVIAGKMMDERTSSAPLPVPSTLVAAPQSGPTSNPGSVVLERGPGGHFQVHARVDGRRIDFMVDSGASFIALRESDADRLGYHVTPRDYTLRMSTANGETRGAPIELGMVEVDGITVRDVKAVVHPDRGLGVNLLGMTFLSRVRWTHDRGRLILEQ